MNKIVVIGIVLLFIGIALAPSINASVINEDLVLRKNKLLKSLQNLDIVENENETKQISLGYSPKRITLLITILALIRVARGIFLMTISSTGWPPETTLPIIHFRGLWLYMSALVWINYWQHLYSLLGLEWELPSWFLELILPD